MDLVKTLYVERHNEVHNGMRNLLKPLSEAQMRARPHESVNSIAWLFWHVARAEDIAVNRLATDGVQVFDEEGWGEQLNVPVRHFGVGMTFAEVDALSKEVNLTAVRAYFDAVYARTLNVIDALEAATLALVVSPEYIHRLVYDDGVGGIEAEFVESVWHERTRGVYLMYLGLTHSFKHFGEAQTVRSLMGIQ